MPSATARRREGFQTEVEIREHRLTIDEPTDRGGTDKGPTPTEVLAASLASCTAITLVMYAERKGWKLGEIEAATDFTGGGPDSPATFRTEIRVPAPLSDEQRERLLVIAGKCPVHKALAAQDVELEDDLQTFEG